MRASGDTLRPGIAGRPLWLWAAFAAVVAAMFLVQHSMGMSSTFAKMMTARSIDEIGNLGTLFEATSGRQIGGLLLGAMGAFLIVQRGRAGARGSGALAGWLLFFLGWNLLSVMWADDPGLTARRLVLFVFMALGAWSLSQRCTPRDLALLTLIATFAWTLIGFYAEQRNGTWAPGAPGYRFCGTLHPNEQAINAALMFFSSFYFFRTAARRRWPWIAMMVFAFGVLYLTRSRTALASTVVAIAAYESLQMTGARRLAVVLWGISAAVAVLLLSDLLLPAVQERLTLGRTDVSETFGTLTGRRPLWDQLTAFAAERPALGYGYAGFWNESNSMAVIEKQGWPISHAHNAYLDVLLETGPVGAAAFIVILLLGLRGAFAAQRLTRDRGYEFFGIVLTFGILNGLLESQVVQRTYLFLLTIAVLAFVAVRAPRPAPAPSPAPAPAGRPAAA